MSLSPGHRLGPYEIVAPLGAEGMGEVYRAKDVRLGRTVAVKILPAELAGDEKYRQRFEREARAASALSHANIAHIYDVGEQDGIHFIAMEHVEGENLRELVSRGPLEADRVVDFGLQMAAALEDAHGAGIVHRDIKSANAVVSPKGQVKILDFGLARRTVEGAAALDSQMQTQSQTEVGVVMGTVPYMSPEQALGKDVDARTDLFSLGVVLYELATGGLPFRGDTATQTIDQICHTSPEPLSGVGRDIPEELERIVRKCLEKDRDRRYATARDLAVDLRNLQRDRESGVSRVTTSSRASRTVPLRLGLAGLVALVVVVAAAAIFWLGRSADRPSITSLAVLPFENATGDQSIEYLSDGISESLIHTTIARTLRLRLSGEDVARLSRRSPGDAEAYRLYLKGREFLVGNQREMDKSVESFQQAIARAPDYALAHAGLAEAYAIQAYLRGMDREEVLDEARAAVDRALELDPELAEAHAALGMVKFYFEWDWAGAESALLRAIELNPGSSTVHEEYGNFLMTMGRLDEGLAESLRAAELDPLAVGPVHDIAINHLVRHDYDQAAAYFRKAIGINPNWTWGYIKLARTLAHQGKCKDALEQAEIGLGRVADGIAPLSRSWLGRTWAICGETERAREQLAWLENLARTQYVDGVAFSAVYGGLGETDEAMRWLERAYEDRTPAMVYTLLIPLLDPSVGDDPRMRSLIRRMGYPTTEAEDSPQATSES